MENLARNNPPLASIFPSRGFRPVAPSLSSKPFSAFILVLAQSVVGLPLFGSVPSTTVLTAPNSSVLGQQVTMTATVSPSAATGNVTFYDGTTILGIRKLASGTAALTTALLPAGVGSLKAYYGGDTTYGPSTSAALAQTVNALPPNGLNPPVPYGAGSDPLAFAVADFNGDGKADLAVGDSMGNSVSVLLGIGDGSFQKAVTYALGNEPTFIAAGDFNGDGRIDLAVTYSGNGIVYVMFGNGDGTFQAAVRSATTGSSLSSVAVGDFNGDGRADLVVANNDYSNGLVTVLLGNGNGTFQPGISLAAGLAPSFVVVGDFNEDGKADLAATNFNGKNISVFLGNGDGTFRPSVFYDVGTYPNSVAIGDFNGDGSADLAVANQFDENVSVLLGNGDGTFKAKVNYAAGGYPAHLAVGDINGDGAIDLVVANQFVPVNGGLSILYGDGTGAFQSPVGYSVGTAFYFVVPEDLNGDGVTDIVLAAGAANNVNVFLAIPGDPDLAIVVSHTGSFSPGQNGATYEISVSNTGALPTSGVVTVTDSLPAGLTAAAIGGDGWICSVGNLTCTRSDALAPAASYPAITLTVNVLANAPTGVTNSVAVSGGGEVSTASGSSSDFTTIFTSSENSQWRQLTATASFTPGHALLLTDGTVAFQEYCSSNWYRLTPDAFGNYVNGTWSSLASMPAGYGPVDYSSAVLADGRLVVIGGIFNETDNCQTEAEVSLGAIYEPRTNAWTPLAAPPGWAAVGEAPNVVLPDGSLLLGSQLTTQMAKLDPATLAWTNLKSTNKADANDEEGWVLLPDGTVLTVDFSYPQEVSGLAGTGMHAETYDPLTDSWTSAGSTIVSLPETGGMMLRPDGTVFAPGQTHTAIYYYRTRTWSAGPDFPDVGGLPLDAGEAGSALLPDGSVLVAEAHTDASAATPTESVATFEFDGTDLIPAPNGNGDDALLLPTGQVLVAFSVYTPTGHPNPAWAPTISAAPGVVQNGETYTITGTQINGLSAGVGSGDERQAATNYPLVRITNSSTGHVFYCRTHGHSTMGVATGATPVSTNFDVPLSIESGPSILEVVANGIPSSPVNVIVTPGGSSSLPSIFPGGTVPAGSAYSAIQPGEWVAIYGANLASSTASWTGNFPMSLGGTSVMIDGNPAYLSYVSPTQINLQAPNDANTGPVPVVVTTAAGVATSTVTLAQFAPSLFLLDGKHVAGIIPRSDGSGAYSGGSYDILGPTGSSLGYPTVAAKAGDVIELYGTGFGPTSPAVTPGQAFSGAASTTNPVQLLINNVGVTPSFAGLSSAGVYQINVTVPAGLGTGDVPLVATVVGAQTATGVVISLQ
jgi:uncharacterized protein (TIGR03437 family)